MCCNLYKKVQKRVRMDMMGSTRLVALTKSYIQHCIHHLIGMNWQSRIVFQAKPRASLHASKHGAVDSFLKSLKLHSRQLQSNLELFQIEYRVLERIYYKGKNQHRTALFWKRAMEARRYCQRLEVLEVVQLFGDFRRSFYEENKSNKDL
jgi:hypothetical protein